ncbi:MAG: hypothetical protein ACXW15_09405 [Acidimicrobiia bacterium]
MTLRKTSVAALVALTMVLGASPALAHGGNTGSEARRDLAKAAKVTAKYHRVGRAINDGFLPFAIPEEAGGTLLTIRGEKITCFDSPDGGMGVHYVRNIDEVLDPIDPEALVYSVGRNGRLQLVALEYIIPEEFVVDPANPPVLFGRPMHHHSYLPVYILHVWIWKWNPDGMFADFNPRVQPCRAG